MTRERNERQIEDEAFAWLREANPATASRLRTAEDEARAERVLRRVMAGDEHPVGRRQPRPWRRSLTTVTAAGVVAALVLLVITTSRTGRIDEGVEDVLGEVALVAGSSPVELPSGPGDYLYVQSTTTDRVTGFWEGQAYSAFLPTVEERWIASDGSGRISRTSADPLFLSEADRRLWEASGSPALGRPPSSKTYDRGKFTAGALTALPTSPGRLFEVIEARARRTEVPVAAEMFVIVADLLREPLAPAPLRASLFRVAARIPGLELLGRVADSLGRPGLAVAMTNTYSGFRERHLLIFDPRTSAVLSEERVLLEPVGWLHADPPATIHERVEVSRATVPSIRARPS